MRFPLLIAIAAFAVASCVSPADAQADSRQSPPALVVDSFYRAFGLERWRDAAHLLDLDAVSGLREEVIRNARRRRPAPPMTAESILEWDPKMPREVAEYQAKQANEASRDMDLVSFEFARVSSLDSLAALPPLDVAARWIEAKGMRWMMRRQLALQRERGCEMPDSVLTTIVAAQGAGVRVLGTVMEDSLAWVLHEDRQFVQDASATTPPRRAGTGTRAFRMIPPRVTTLRLVDGAWRIEPGYEFGNVSFAVDCSGARKARPTSR